MAYEVTKNLPLETAEVETPLERMRASGGGEEARARADPARRTRHGRGASPAHPLARVGHTQSTARHDTLEPVTTTSRFPPARRRAISSCSIHARDPAARRRRRERAEARRRPAHPLPLLVAAPEGVGRMLETHPDVPRLRRRAGPRASTTTVTSCRGWGTPETSVRHPVARARVVDSYVTVLIMT